MFGGGDADRVNVLAGDQLPEIGIDIAALESCLAAVRLLDPPLRMFTSRPIHLANRDRLDVAESQQFGKMIVVGHLAAANEADRDSIAGRRLALRAKNGGGHDGRHRDRTRGDPADGLSAGEVGSRSHDESPLGLESDAALSFLSLDVAQRP